MYRHLGPFLIRPCPFPLRQISLDNHWLATTDMSYQISSRDYLCRAREQLALSKADALFYASFELRAGVEARMSEYLEAQQQISRKLKEGWRIAVLGRGIDQAFKLGEKLARFSFREAVSGEELFILYYTPVSGELQKNAQKLGDYLHHQKLLRCDNDEWWNIFRRKLERTSELLCRSCTGTLLGPPLMRRTKEIKAFVETMKGYPVDISEHFGAGNRFDAAISYPARFPSEFEPNAYIWRPDYDFK